MSSVLGRIRRHWKGLLATAVVVAVGVPYAYIHLLSGPAPEPLSLADASAAPSVPAGASRTPSASTGSPVTDLSGTWTVEAGSRAGYRVKETLVGQHTTAVGRTAHVTGSVQITGTKVTSGEFTVQMATVTSGRGERDARFTGSIMDTGRYPTGTFRLTQPIRLGALPAVDATVTAHAAGDLTLRGVTKSVTLTVRAERRADSIAVDGDIPIRYQDYGIGNPSIGGFVSVGDSGTIEFLLVLTKG